jgi:site-specific DNA-methyltransferase (adenine-specific)
MKTERVPIGSVQFDPANVRRHGEKNLDAIKASLSRFGQQKPIVVDADGIVRAGNGTLMAAKALGWPEVTIVRTSLKGAEATAYAIADNRTAELAEWDDDALAQTLAALQIEDEELAKATGFDDADIDAMLAPDEVTEDEVPEPPVDPITKSGDLWILGEHRLLCGDSTKATDVAMLMQNQLCKLVVTDPPYGVSYADKNAFLNAFDKGNRVQTPIENDHLDKADAHKLWKDAFTHMGASMDAGACVYCFMPQGGDQMMMMMMMQGAGIEPRHELIWLKNNHVLGRTDYAYKHEPIMYAWKKGGHKFYGEFQTSILEFARPSSSKLHPTMKPVELICKLIENSSRQGEILYEPFCGSGTTLIAAEQLGRKCYGMEISPAYCDVIVKRWETLTGKKATRG